MDALLNALMLLATLAMAAFLVTTGWSRFTSGRASGFTRAGAPYVAFPHSAILGAAEIALGVGLLVLPPPASMVAAYAAMVLTLVYAVLAWRNWRREPEGGDRRPGDVTGRALGILITLCGVAVLAFTNAMALRPALMRLLDPTVAAWVVGLAAVAALGVRASRTGAARHA